LRNFDSNEQALRMPDGGARVNVKKTLARASRAKVVVNGDGPA
jgi:hypothetical protein